MAEDEEDLHRLNNFDREGLPNSGSEREIIEYYFHKGFKYKNIVLFLQRYHCAGEVNAHLPRLNVK
jgi:hypothetical protein